MIRNQIDSAIMKYIIKYLTFRIVNDSKKNKLYVDKFILNQIDYRNKFRE